MIGHFEGRRKRRLSAPRVIGAVVGSIALALLLALGLGWLIMYLWNNTLVVIFQISSITYWQAVGLFILAKLFFSIGHYGSRRAYKSAGEKRRRWVGAVPDEEGGLPPGEADFKHYWQEEGKQAFRAYMERKGEGNHSCPK